MIAYLQWYPDQFNFFGHDGYYNDMAYLSFLLDKNEFVGMAS